jgi:hypothetical protein
MPPKAAAIPSLEGGANATTDGNGNGRVGEGSWFEPASRPACARHRIGELHG